jgi:hypothetical protein
VDGRGVRECEIIYLKFETTSQLASSTISYPGGSSPVFFRFSVVTFWMMALYLWNEQGIPPLCATAINRIRSCRYSRETSSSPPSSSLYIQSVSVSPAGTRCVHPVTYACRLDSCARLDKPLFPHPHSNLQTSTHQHPMSTVPSRTPCRVRHNPSHRFLLMAATCKV